MSLCVPCANRCRYCLLSYDGRVSGSDYERSESYAKQFYEWIQSNRPDLSFLFGFGYSMEHPRLLDAIDFCRSIGSPTAEFLQFDGMKFRTSQELNALLGQLKEHGVKLIGLTFYGTEEYHDRFAARQGDYRLMMNTLSEANRVGLDVTVNIPLNHENTPQIAPLIADIQRHRTKQISCFIPHSEGRGHLLEPIRFSAKDYSSLNDDVRSRINGKVYKTEGEWLRNGFPRNEKRVLTLTLTPENIYRFERMPFEETIAYLEKLDDDYYTAIPTVEELTEIYGNEKGECYYSARDLYLVYQRRYLAEHQIKIYDVNDERQCFSRRLS